MSKFNASVNTIGITEVKVRQALMKLLENSMYNKERAIGNRNELEEQIRRLSQKLSTIDFNIDSATAQEIADKISVDLSECVSRSEAGAATSTTKAAQASESAASAAEDAGEVAQALANMESTIAQYAAQAAATAISQVTQNVSTAVSQAQGAAQTATTAAQNATIAAESASEKADDATEAAKSATAAVVAMKNVNLAVNTVYNTSSQYRKIATFPAVSTEANASVTIYGSMGGWTNATQKPIYFSLGQRQSGNTYSDIDVKAFVFGSSLSSSADVVLYKESNNTFSLYLKGAAASYFKHNLAMMYNEQVTLALGSFTTAVPTGTQVWSMLANCKVVSTSDHNHDGVYAAVGHNHNGVYQPAGDYAASNHNHDGTYAPASHSHRYVPKTIEKIGWSHVNVDLDNSTFVMAGLVSDTSATYNLKVTFINTTTTARSCLVNGTTVSLAGGNGQTASHQTTVSGSGTFTIDNIVASVDVFVRIWR